MDQLLSQMSEYIEHADRTDDDISKWSVGMQLHHALLAINGICTALVASEPGREKESFSLLRSLILFFRRIPRGKGNAPETALPEAEITQADLSQLVQLAATNYQLAADSSPSSWWRHPRFGVMTRDTVLRFVETHTQHHLLIASDIIESSH